MAIFGGILIDGKGEVKGIIENDNLNEFVKSLKNENWQKANEFDGERIIDGSEYFVRVYENGMEVGSEWEFMEENLEFVKEELKGKYIVNVME